MHSQLFSSNLPQSAFPLLTSTTYIFQLNAPLYSYCSEKEDCTIFFFLKKRKKKIGHSYHKTGLTYVDYMYRVSPHGFLYKLSKGCTIWFLVSVMHHSATMLNFKKQTWLDSQIADPMSCALFKEKKSWTQFLGLWKNKATRHNIFNEKWKVALLQFWIMENFLPTQILGEINI